VVPSFVTAVVQRQFCGEPRSFADPERDSVKCDILRILWDGPRHCDDIMFEIEQQRGYRPKPASVYPTLQLLQDGDFVTNHLVGGKRVYEISDTGSELLATHLETESAAGSNEPS
jgi:DNA-binding PadR family transcriptional regulator